MTIKAKFAGTCKICVKPIRVGEEIEWEKGTGAMHITCKGKTPVPLNSAPPAQLVSAGTDLAALAQQYGHTLTGEPRVRHYNERVHKGETLKAIGSTFDAREGKMLVIARTKPQYLSADYLEDMDMFDMRPGLYYELSAISVARSSDEQAKRDKDAAEKSAMKQQKESLCSALRASYSAETNLGGSCPEGVKLESIWAENRMAGSETWYLGSDGVVYFMRSDYDMGPMWWKTSATAEQIAAAKEIPGLRPGL